MDDASDELDQDAARAVLASVLVLARDGGAVVSALARQALRRVLRRLPLLDQTLVAAEWATHPDERVRLALIEALPGHRHAIGLRTAIDHLWHDDVPQVRAAAVYAFLRLDRHQPM